MYVLLSDRGLIGSVVTNKQCTASVITVGLVECWLELEDVILMINKTQLGLNTNRISNTTNTMRFK